MDTEDDLGLGEREDIEGGLRLGFLHGLLGLLLGGLRRGLLRGGLLHGRILSFWFVLLTRQHSNISLRKCKNYFQAGRNFEVFLTGFSKARGPTVAGAEAGLFVFRMARAMRFKRRVRRCFFI